jgi:hypothetical protein
VAGRSGVIRPRASSAATAISENDGAEPLGSLGGINTRNRPYHSSFSGDSRDRRIPYAGRYDRGTRHRHRREGCTLLGVEAVLPRM